MVISNKKIMNLMIFCIDKIPVIVCLYLKYKYRLVFVAIICSIGLFLFYLSSDSHCCSVPYYGGHLYNHVCNIVFGPVYSAFVMNIWRLLIKKNAITFCKAIKLPCC